MPNKRNSRSNKQQPIKSNNQITENQQNTHKYKKSSTDIINQYLKNAQQRIIGDLQEQKIMIPNQPKSLLKEDDKQRLLRQKKEHEIKQLKKEKQSAKLHLQQLDQQQRNLIRQKYQRQKNQLKNSRITLNMNQSSVSRVQLMKSRVSKSSDGRVLSVMQNSQITKKMKKLRKQRQQFEKRFIDRAQSRQKSIQEIQKQVKSLKEEMLLALKQNNKKKAQEGLSQLQKRKNQRSLKHQQQKKRIQQLKKKWNLHDGMEKYWQLTHKKQQQLKIQKSRAKYNKLNWKAQQIKEHAKKYDQILEKQRAHRSNKILELSRVANSIPHSYHTAFYDQIITQQKNKKQRPNPKLIAQQQRQKIRAFDQYVRNQKKPTVKSQEPFQISQQESKEKKVLQYHQAVQLGNEYLRQGNKRIKAKTEKEDIVDKQNADPIKKINYLPDLKAKRKDMIEKDRNYPEKSREKYWKEIQKAKKIVNSNITHEEKLQQIRQISQQIQSDQIIVSNKITDKISAKLKILAMIQQ